MTNKAKIKVIKKSEIKVGVKKAVMTANVDANLEKKTNRVAAREMVSTVTNWVTEFQRNKREETKLAFEKLFAAQPQVSEM